MLKVFIEFLKLLFRDEKTLKKLASYSSKDIWYITAIIVYTFVCLELASSVSLLEKEKTTLMTNYQSLEHRLYYTNNKADICLEDVERLNEKYLACLSLPSLKPRLPMPNKQETHRNNAIITSHELDINDRLKELE